MKKKIVLMVLLLLGGCSMMQNTNSTGTLKSADVNQTMNHKKDYFVASEGVSDGYVFIFHIMPAPEGQGFSRINYHLMVSIEKDGNPLTHLRLFSSVKHPDGSVEEKAPMMQMGNWYMALYNLSHDKGRHWLTASFEQNGKTYSSGVYYPERPYYQPVNK